MNTSFRQPHTEPCLEPGYECANSSVRWLVNSPKNRWHIHNNSCWACDQALWHCCHTGIYGLLIYDCNSHQQVDVASFHQRLQLALRVCCKIRLAMMPQTASAVRSQSPVLCRHWSLFGWAIWPFEMLIKHPAAWVTGSIGSMRDSKAARSDWRSCPSRLIRLSASSLWVVCTFASSPDIFLRSPVRVMVASMLYTQLVFVWGFSVIPIMPPGPRPFFVQFVSMNISLHCPL